MIRVKLPWNLGEPLSHYPTKSSYDNPKKEVVDSSESDVGFHVMGT